METNSQEPEKTKETPSQEMGEAKPQPPSLSPAELKALFDEVKAVDGKEYELTQQLNLLKREKSAIIKIIHDKAGKGPFEYESVSLTIMGRKDTYYFKQDRRSPIKVA
jgi:hypothetical protein